MVRPTATILTLAGTLAAAIAVRAAPGAGNSRPPDSIVRNAYGIDVETHPGKALFTDNCAAVMKAVCPRRRTANSSRRWRPMRSSRRSITASCSNRQRTSSRASVARSPNI